MPKLNKLSTLMLQTAIDSGITSPKELANIMGNAQVETFSFTTMEESSKYTSAKQMMLAVSSVSKRYSIEQIEEAISSKDPKEIFTILYENRSKLGNINVGDGYKFHGRGFFQYTGRYNYTKFGKEFNVDLSNHPELAAQPVMAAKLAVAYWEKIIPEKYRENPRVAGEKINGGTNGVDRRVKYFHEWEKFITPSLVKDFQLNPRVETQPYNIKPTNHNKPNERHSNHKDKQQASPVAALPDNLSKQLAELKDFAYPNPGINKQYNTAQIDNICASALNKLCARGNQNQELLDVAITQDYKEITVYYNNRLGNENSISLDANMAASIPHDETVAQLEKTINQHLTEQQNLEQQRNQSHGPRTV